MECSVCKHENPPGSVRCAECNSGLDVDQDKPTSVGVVSGWSSPVAAPAQGAAPVAVLASLQPGTILAGRYEILQVLGEGGMGAVFKARDTDLDRLVAVKVIRPELAGRPEILHRFKQELILARQVTHRNVIRIFDLGQAEGTKFITMEYIEGEDLKHLLRQKQKLHPEEVVPIMEQVCLALEAAHSEGVVHRDLKPQNIMIDRNGRVVVMDFGIARSMEMAGMTQTGTMLGTPEYMSPEQARGEKVDRRSDLFTLGIIFYELLTGVSPYPSETAMGSLLKRIQEPSRPPTERDATIPEALSNIVGKCLERSAAERYQNARGILEDLEIWKRAPAGAVLTAVGAAQRTAWQADAPTLLTTAVPGTAVTLPPPPPLPTVERRRGPLTLYRKWIAAGAVVLVVAAAAWMLRGKWVLRPPPAREKAVTVLVADFDNATGDPVLNGTLEPTFITALEGASFISAVSRGEARREAAELRAGVTKLDESAARLVAARQGIDYIVSGAIERQGGGYRLSVKAINAATGKAMVTENIDVADKKGVLVGVGKMAARVRNALGDDTPESLQLAAAETYTAASLEAAQTYGRAQELRFAGKGEEAIQLYLQATQLDPNFGIAYAGLGMAYHNLGQRTEAEKYFQLALARIDRLSDREKYRARGAHYMSVRNHEKAIEEFTALVKQYPVDMAGLNNLAFAYYLKHDMAQAVEQGRRALQIYPQNVPQRNNVAQYALYAGDFDTAVKMARDVVETRPSYLKAYRALALAELTQGKPDQAAGTYHRLEAVSPLGASFAALGLADLSLFQGRPTEAVALLEKTVDADLASKNPTAAAKKLATLAQANLTLGRKGPALAAADRALASSKDPSVVFMAAQVYLDAGQQAKTGDLTWDLSRRLEADPQAYAMLIDGAAQLKRGNAREAIKLFREAQRLADTWIGHLELGRAYLEAGAFPEADSEFDRCLRRRGEATEMFLDDVPTYRYLPLVHYYLGRAREGLNSPGAADSYRAFLAIKEKAEKDPLVEDARKRLAGR